MSRETSYQVLLKYSELYTGKPNKFQLQRLSEKLEECDPKHLEAALDHHSEANKFFPNFKDITEALRDVKSKFKTEKVACPKCGGDGLAVLFNKKTFGRAAFACDCLNGLRHPEVKPRKFAGANWIERAQFVDTRLSMTDEERAKRLDEYWAGVFGIRTTEAPQEKPETKMNNLALVSF